MQNLLALLCRRLGQWKLRPPKPIKSINGPDNSEIKVWVIPLHRSQAANKVAVCKGLQNASWEKVVIKYQLQLCNQLQNQGLRHHEYLILILLENTNFRDEVYLRRYVWVMS